MARRRLSEQPTSRLAIWSRRIALFSLAATLIAVIVVRSGALEIVPALSTLGGALVLAILAILLAFGAAVSIWKDGVGGVGEAVTGLLIGRGADRLSALSRRQSLPAAGDLRRHHRSDRPAAVRGDRAAAPARCQSGHLCRPLHRRAAARRLFRHRARSHHRVAARGLRRRAQGHRQAPVACGRCAAAAGDGAARRPDRGDRAHADPRFPRRCRRARARDAGGRPHRRALGLALWPPRSRRQRRAGARADRRCR